MLGRAAVFASCFELKPAFDILLSRPTKLTLVTDEMFEPGFARQLGGEIEEGSEAVMEGVEHLGQYVFEMTKAKVEALKSGGGELTVANGERMVVDGDDEGDREEDVIVKDEEYVDEDEDVDVGAVAV